MKNLKQIVQQNNIDREQFASIVESLFKRAKAGLPEAQLDHLVAEKTNAYAKALNDIDAAKAILQDIATELPSEKKTKLEAAIQSTDHLTIFNGNASMDFNHTWNDPFNAET